MTPQDPIGAFSQKQRTLETLPNESEGRLIYIIKESVCTKVDGPSFFV